MANMMDYLAWRGDLTVQQAPWCMVDSLIMASFSYNPLSSLLAAESAGIPLRDLAPQLDLKERTGNLYFEQWRSLLYAMANSTRFGSMHIHDYVDIVDEKRAMQFSAVSADTEDGCTFVAFRGTDSTLVGWREDFNMSYESPVPAQESAVDYLERIAAQSTRPLRVSGHSKGGNLAAYAAAHARTDVQARIQSIYSFDGPGLDDATMASEGYQRILPVLHSIIPQASVVGFLMNYHLNYTVVRSRSVSLWQHDAFKWQILGPRFEEGGLTNTSRLMDETVHEWLKACDAKQRKVFVETLFDVLSATDATTIAELSSEKIKSVAVILTAIRDMEPETRKMFLHLISMFLSMAATNARGMFSERQKEFLQETINKLRPEG